MEKQRNYSVTKLSKRLLAFISFLILVFFASGQDLSWAKANELRVLPAENQNLYAKSELKFEVLLPGVAASKVQVQTPDSIKDVTFKTLRKTEMYTGETGTKIEIWFVFEKKGTYKLPPLVLLVNGRRRTISYEPVTITNNPANMSSRIVIEFDNGTVIYSDETLGDKPLFESEVGKTIFYTIYLQYAVQLIQFNWDLPKDSILTQTKTYEITEIKYREKNYSDELIPVASFEWVSLTEGLHTMPSLRLVATGYNGYRNAITMPDFNIRFKKSSLSEYNEADALFVEAFNNNYIHSTQSDSVNLTDEQCEILAELRHNERTATFNYIISRKIRKSYEESLILPVYENEFCLVLLYLAIILFVVILIIFLILTKLKKQLGQILCSTLLVCSMVFLIYSIVQSSKRYGICKQGELLSVPEKTATASNEITAGTRIRILEKTEGWYYVEVGDFGGWIEKSAVCEI